MGFQPLHQRHRHTFSHRTDIHALLFSGTVPAVWLQAQETFVGKTMMFSQFLQQSCRSTHPRGVGFLIGHRHKQDIYLSLKGSCQHFLSNLSQHCQSCTQTAFHVRRAPSKQPLTGLQILSGFLVQRGSFHRLRQLFHLESQRFQCPIFLNSHHIIMSRENHRPVGVAFYQPVDNVASPVIAGNFITATVTWMCLEIGLFFQGFL